MMVHFPNSPIPREKSGDGVVFDERHPGPGTGKWSKLEGGH